MSSLKFQQNIESAIIEEDDVDAEILAQDAASKDSENDWQKFEKNYKLFSRLYFQDFIKALPV